MLVQEYLQALSGQEKAPSLVARYVSDESLAHHIEEIEAAFPCYELVPWEILAEGDRVVVRAEFRGVHRGRFAGIEPTGRAVSAGLIIIYRIKDCKIAEHWMQFDTFGLLQQLQIGKNAAA